LYSKLKLKKNNLKIKKILLNTSLRKVNYNIIIYNIRVKDIFKNIKKKEAKILIKVNKNIYSNLI